MRGSLPYDAIAALDPALFVQFRYATYGGTQVLFQDAACTVPVEVAMQDTIGGVKDPFNGQIVATQSTAAHRPLWGGEDVGAVFDGVDDRLVGSPDLSLGGEFFVGIAGEVLTYPSTGNVHLFDGRGAASATLAFRVGADDVFFRADDGSQPSTQPVLAYGTTRATFFAQADNGSAETYRSNTLSDQQAVPINSMDFTDWAIGAQPITTASYIHAEVSECLILSGAQDPAARSSIHGALEAA